MKALEHEGKGDATGTEGGGDCTPRSVSCPRPQPKSRGRIARSQQATRLASGRMSRGAGSLDENRAFTGGYSCIND